MSMKAHCDKCDKLIEEYGASWIEIDKAIYHIAISNGRNESLLCKFCRTNILIAHIDILKESIGEIKMKVDLEVETYQVCKQWRSIEDIEEYLKVLEEQKKTLEFRFSGARKALREAIDKLVEGKVK